MLTDTLQSVCTVHARVCCMSTQRVSVLTLGCVCVAVPQDSVQGSHVHPQLQAADSQQLAEADARCHHRWLVEALQRQVVHLVASPLQPNMPTQTHTWRHKSDRETKRLSGGRLSSHSQQRDVAAAAQLLHQEGGEGERRAAVAEVVQEVQVLHQGKAVDQVAAGEVWQLRSLC